MRIVAVIQARIGSTRLPGKVLELIGPNALIIWTVEAMEAVPGVTEVVVATTIEPADDELVDFLRGRVHVHRGPVHDVLHRLWEAVRPFEPDLVVRQTADNPFADPWVIGGQVRAVIENEYDYVGIASWPIGIAGEVARATGMEEADRLSIDAAEREHVMPYLYARPERFRVGVHERGLANLHGRYTVDTVEDLLLAREIARRLGHAAPVRLEELEAIVRADPDLMTINQDVRQRHWTETEASAQPS